MKCLKCGSTWHTQDHPGEFSCVPCGAVTYPANFVPLKTVVREPQKVLRQFKCGHPHNAENTIWHSRHQYAQCLACHPELVQV